METNHHSIQLNVQSQSNTTKFVSDQMQRKIQTSNIRLQDNKQQIQYYQYIRSIMESNQLPYWIGNPSVQIISGNIILQPLKQIKIKKQPQNYDLYLQCLKQVNFANSLQDERYSSTSDKMQHNKKEEEHNLLSAKTIDKMSVNKRAQEYIHQVNTFNFNQNNLIKSRSLVLCGIPNSKSPIEVLQTEQITYQRSQIIEVRVIKTTRIKYYAMLLLFKDNTSAGNFYCDFFGEQYNSLQMQRILLREMKEISLSFTELNKTGDNQMLLLRQLRKDQQFVSPQNIFMTYHHYTFKNQQKKQINQNEASSALTCAICFQECQTEVISILCGHYFDIKCLERWSQNICPLCRYHQQPPIIKFCQLCNQCEGLWICLICGSRLCCGIKNDILASDSHIYSHFKQLGHSLSMELQTKFLFDARIPAFLHKKFYGQLMKSNDKQQKIIDQKKDYQRGKKDKITRQIKQYQNQVGQQMRKQRSYFEEQINQQIFEHRETLNKKRQNIEKLKSQNEDIDMQEASIKNKIQIHTQNIKTSQNQIQIAKKLQKMYQTKIQQKKNKFNNFASIKIKRLNELDEMIQQKKDQLKNYVQNIKLKQRLTDKLKNEKVSSEVVFQVNQKKKAKKKDKN